MNQSQKISNSISDAVRTLANMIGELQTIREEVKALEASNDLGMINLLEALKHDIAKRVKQNIYIDSEDLIELDTDSSRTTFSVSFGIDESKLTDMIESEIEDAFDDLIRDEREKQQSVTEED